MVVCWTLLFVHVVIRAEVFFFFRFFFIRVFQVWNVVFVFQVGNVVFVEAFSFFFLVIEIEVIMVWIVKSLGVFIEVVISSSIFIIMIVVPTG